VTSIKPVIKANRSSPPAFFATMFQTECSSAAVMTRASAVADMQHDCR
jgi:hypothetical protein